MQESRELGCLIFCSFSGGDNQKGFENFLAGEPLPISSGGSHPLVIPSSVSLESTDTAT